MSGTAPPPPSPAPPPPLPMRGRGVPPSPTHLTPKHESRGTDRVPGPPPPPPPPPPSDGRRAEVYPKGVGRYHGHALPRSRNSYVMKLANALWNDEQRHEKGQMEPGPLASVIETCLLPKWQKPVNKTGHGQKPVSAKPEKIDLRRATNTASLLTQVKMSLPDMMRDKTPSPRGPSPPRYGALPLPRRGGAPPPSPPPPPNHENAPSPHAGRAHTPHPPPTPPKYGASPPTPPTPTSFGHPPPMYGTPSLIREGAPQGPQKWVGPKSEKVQLIDIWKATNTEVMLKLLKMPVPDMLAAVFGMDDSVLDINQVESLIKYCPTKEEMELLKNYTGDKSTLGRCEKYYLELVKVPRVESKFRVLSFKIQLHTQITELKKDLDVVKFASVEIRTSQKLKEIMKMIGNTLDQRNAGSAVGFKLDSLSKLSDICAANSKMTLMHYLCKVLASEASVLLDFHKDLESLESASKIQLKSLVEEMQTIWGGLDKSVQELGASKSDGPISEYFCKTLNDFISTAESEMATVSSLYCDAERNADALALYFGEDLSCYPFEQITTALLNFIRLFKKAHEENIKQEELEKKKDAKEAVMEKEKGVSLTRKSSLKPIPWVTLTWALQGSLWAELQIHGEGQIATEVDVSTRTG